MVREAERQASSGDLDSRGKCSLSKCRQEVCIACGEASGSRDEVRT